MRKYLLLLFIVFSLKGHSQQMSIAGTVQDTVAKTPLQYAIAMAVRLKDSTLVAFTRTDANGHFQLKGFPIDTVQVIISNPRFGDQVYYVFGSASNNTFDFGKIILPPKSHLLNEVVIYAFKDPVYYKGDTLVYTADSFKVKPNATVEDLLKKLPGMRVDAQGKITSQGKKVDQVLVDGDEFFGADPTIATRNLNANTVESVQVYEKKNDNASGDGTDETLQVLNLKLKDDAKKGYFGKVSAASDFQKFGEGEFLANKFRKKQKISVFALASNTPKSSIGFGDMYKYGLDNEMNFTMNGEDDEMWYTYNDQKNAGIPRTLKSGFYYSDKITKNTKVGLNYSYNISQVATRTETTNQYFLADTTYKTNTISETKQRAENHSVNLNIDQTLDSLTDLHIISKFKYSPGSVSSHNLNRFLTTSDTLIHETEIENSNKTSNYDLANTVKLDRRFKKRDRKLTLTYNYNLTSGMSAGALKSSSFYYTSSLFPNDSIDQQKQNVNSSQVHGANITYVEPITKKIKLEFSYDLNFYLSNSDKKTKDYSNGEYNTENSALTNDFRNERMINKAGLKFTYEVKKFRFTAGSKARQVTMSNYNVLTSVKSSHTVNNILPFMTYRYKISDNKSVTLEYSTNSSQPSLSQLQPVPDNTNPDQVRIGNPALLPTFTNHIGLSFNSYKPISGKYIWTNANFRQTDNDLTNSINYDSLGRTITQTVNVNGNYTGDFYLGAGIPLFSKMLQIDPSVNGSIFKNTNFINGEKNLTQQTGLTAALQVTITTDSLEISFGGNYNYNIPYSTLNKVNNKPYSQSQYTASIGWKLPFKFRLETNGEYNIYSHRPSGYNKNYVIWNASLIKTFGKLENILLSVDAVDLLNQNTNTKRTVQDNVITDTKTNIVGRYIMLRLVYKFNSSKQKEQENEMF